MDGNLAGLVFVLAIFGCFTGCLYSLIKGNLTSSIFFIFLTLTVFAVGSVISMNTKIERVSGFYNLSKEDIKKLDIEVFQNLYDEMFRLKTEEIIQDSIKNKNLNFRG